MEKKQQHIISMAIIALTIEFRAFIILIPPSYDKPVPRIGINGFLYIEYTTIFTFCTTDRGRGIDK